MLSVWADVYLFLTMDSIMDCSGVALTKDGRHFSLWLQRFVASMKNKSETFVSFGMNRKRCDRREE